MKKIKWPKIRLVSLNPSPKIPKRNLFGFAPIKKSKKQLSYAEAIIKYPRLSPFGDADKDGKLNMFDCKPFNKKKHTVVSFKNKKINIKTPGQVLPLVNVLNKKGRAYVVGGFVRDMLLERPPKDVDIEVHGMDTDSISKELKSAGYHVDEVGKSFGVLKVSKDTRKEAIDVAVPRTDSTGRKPKVEFLKDVTPKEAARRRDFTINAIMYDTKDDKIVDPYEGIEDLNKGKIRAVSEQSFSDDPLRVIRAAQFASRFDFDVDEDTVKKAKEAKLDELSGERIQEELRKVSAKSTKPSKFFTTLDEMGHLKTVFPEVERLKGIQQDKIHHPEGDAFQHTMGIIDKLAKKKDHEMFLAGVLHDVGKATTTKVEPETGKIAAIGHEEESVKMAKNFMDRFHYPEKEKRNVARIVELHMKPHHLVVEGATKLKYKNRLLAKTAGNYRKLASNPKEAMEQYKKLIEFAEEDVSDEKLRPTYEKLKKLPPIEKYKPKLDGKKLVEQGYKGSEIGRRLEEAYKNQLAGISEADIEERELDLKQAEEENKD